MTSLSTDIHPVGARIFFLPVELRVPLKFGAETLTRVTCVRVELAVAGVNGRRANGVGETLLSAPWGWPSATLSYGERESAMMAFCGELTQAWGGFDASGHPLEIGAIFLDHALPGMVEGFNRKRDAAQTIPWLAALICASAFDIALHDAFGRLHNVDVYRTYNAQWMRRDLSVFLEPAEGVAASFEGRYPADYLADPPATTLLAWHLVGGADPVDASELTGSEPSDGEPVLLRDWIRRDGLRCLKVKLRGNDAAWDMDRMERVGALAIDEGVHWLSADFNCTVREPDYVNAILDRLRDAHPRLYGMLLYVEQPFGYDLEADAVDAHSVSARKPLFLDESAHDWRHIRLGRNLGWTGVALKSCKTQSGALLSLCWARAHGMTLMVQDLTNPMLAIVPHARLAAHAATIAGVEVNATQFCPAASKPEARVHPGIYRRRNGCIDLSTLRGPGFGYRLDDIGRALPEASVTVGDIG